MCQIEKIIQSMLEKGEKTNVSTVLERVLLNNKLDVTFDSLTTSAEIQEALEKLSSLTGKGSPSDIMEAHEELASLYERKRTIHIVLASYNMVEGLIENIKKYLPDEDKGSD